MNLEAATKQVRAAKRNESYMVFTFNYGERYILPHKDGVALMQAIATAEQIPSYFPSDKPPEIKQLGAQGFRMEAMSQAEYEDIKIAALLGISLNDLQEARKPKQEPLT